MTTLALAWRQLRRDLAAGDVRILLAALVLAVVAVTAVGFVTEPSLLFADEPTGNLDTHTGEAIIELLFALNHDAGTTLVLVTHDEHLASRCGRLLRLDSGRLVGDETRMAATA